MARRGGKGGRKKKRSRKGGGLFKPPRHKDLAKIVTFESVSGARQAARKLKQLFKNASCERKLIILRATQYAANRAKAGAKNPKFSASTKRKWLQVSRIYEKASDWMEKRYIPCKR